MLFLVTGPDTYRARHLLAELRAKFAREVDPTGMNMATIDGMTVTLANLHDHLRTTPLLARRRFVVFEKLLTQKNPELFEDLKKLLADDSEDAHVVVLYEPDEVPSKHPLTSWLATYARSFHFPPLAERALREWTIEAIREHGRTVEPRALDRLLAVTSNDLWAVRQEIDKLDAYLVPGVAINEDTVVALVVEPFDDDIFPFVDAIVAGDASRAAPLLMEQLERGMSPQQLIALVEKSLRVLLVIAQPASAGRLAPSLPGIHPYVARKLTPLAVQYGFNRVKKIYADLAAIDVDLKTSGGDAKTLLLRYLTRVALKGLTSPSLAAKPLESPPLARDARY